MADQEPHGDGLLAGRLRELFNSGRTEDGKPLSAADVAAAINAAAGESVISGTYVWQLRTGRRDNPTYKHLIALSRVFGVSPAFFFEVGELERGMMPPEIVAVVRDDEVREIALRASGLSERSLRVIRDLVDHARELEHGDG